MTSQLAGWWGVGEASLSCTQKFSKIAVAHATAWRFSNGGLVKTNFYLKDHEKGMDTLSITFENFKISSLLTEI
jgi:hypothetical protein